MDKARGFLVIGGSGSHVPFVKAARRAGFYTAVADRDPDSPARAAADAFYAVSTHDETRLLGVAAEVDSERGLAGLLTYASDARALASVARVTEARNLSGFSSDAVLVATNKACMKRALRRAGVPTPDWALASKETEALEFTRACDGPVLIKPAVGTVGSLGVALARTEKEGRRGFAEAADRSLDGDVLLERFCEGVELSINGIVARGEPHLLAACRKLNLGAERSFIIAGFSTLDPSGDRDGSAAAAIRVTLDAVRALGIDNSFFAADVIVSPAGPTLLEVGLLLDAKIDRLLDFAGIDVYDQISRVAAGLDLEPPRPCPRGFALRFLFGPEPRREVLPDHAEGERSLAVEWESRTGEFPPRSLADTFGWVMARARSSEEAYASATRFARSCGATLLGRSVTSHESTP